MLIRKQGKMRITLLLGVAMVFLFSSLIACVPLPPLEQETPTPIVSTEAPQNSTPTPIPTRPVYDPGTLVDYQAQSGDSLSSVAAHFNTTLEEILQANPELSETVTTLSPGQTYRIPIYYEALWGTPFQILPDAAYVNGPAGIGFDTRAFVDASNGWLKSYSALAGDETRRGGDLIDFIALNYSVSPRLLLALAEYQLQALSEPEPPEGIDLYPLGYEDQFHKGFYLQLVWAVNTLNNTYYAWRRGNVDTINRQDGTIEHPDPWQNAATVALQNYFSLVLPSADYQVAIYSDGLASTYAKLFGDPWSSSPAHIPGDLQQPLLTLPFQAGKTWTYTGGPHAAWGEGEPLAAIDFAPPSVIGGCGESVEYVTAIADGQIVRSEPAIAVLDLDADGDERTGWVIFYLHLATNDRVRPGIVVKQGDPIGHPSCEGGQATGTHVHIARKFNGEWMLAEGAVSFNLDGWIAGNGKEPYLGTLRKFGRVVEACTCSDPSSQIKGGE